MFQNKIIELFLVSVKREKALAGIAEKRLRFSDKNSA